jgi:hypothetical protein
MLFHTGFLNVVPSLTDLDEFGRLQLLACKTAKEGDG